MSSHPSERSDPSPQVPDVSPEVPGPTWRILLALIGRLPAKGMSRAFGRIADVPVPEAARPAVFRAFASAVGIDLDEVELPLDRYGSLNEFFVRRLREGARRWPADPEAIVSPVDGIVGRFGPIDGETAVQAKGHSYSVAELLADPDAARPFRDGRFVTIYLSPRHYHRIHTPSPGEIVAAAYVPGSLYPVNAPAVMRVPGLFARNERLVCHLRAARGPCAIVAVGAYNVGRISAAFDPDWGGDRPWVTNRRPPPSLRRVYQPPRPVAAGEEIMAFHLGSTVVLLFPPDVPLRPDLRPGAELRVGEPLAP